MTWIHYLLAATVGLSLVCPALAARPRPKVPESIGVSDLLKTPGRFLDQEVAVRGVIIRGGGEWVICDGVPRPDKKIRGTWALDRCVALQSLEPFDEQAEHYFGAIAMASGLYWNRCLQDVKGREPDYAQEVCEPARHNGVIGAHKIRVEEHAPLGSFAEGHEPEDVSLSEGTSEIKSLVIRLVKSIRRSDADAIAMLFADEDRGWPRVHLQNSRSRAHWIFFEPGMTRFSPHATEHEIGYRMLAPGGTNSWWRELCICRINDCRNAWPTNEHQLEHPVSEAAPYFCYRSKRTGEHWDLDWNWE